MKWYMIGLLLGLCIGAYPFYIFGKWNMQKQAIERGHAEHNISTGEWQWKD